MIGRDTAAGLERVLLDYGIGFGEAPPLAALADHDIVRTPVQQAALGELGTFAVLYTESMTLTSVAEAEAQIHDALPLLVLGPRIGARSADALRSVGINFVDAGGNAFLRRPALLIDVRGRPAPRLDDGVLKKRMNLFSTKRAQVIFCLLSWPELVGSPIRTLAARACVSVGLAQETVDLLRHLGHLDAWSRSSSLRRVPSLIDGWVAAYPLALGSLDRAWTFRGETAVPKLPEGATAFVSGEAAVSDLRGTTLSLFVDDWRPELARLNRWRSDRASNVVVRKVFWSGPEDPNDSAGLHIAPPLLVYADLLSAGEGRQGEAAEALRAKNPDLRAR
jgi:hypothetical protein